MDTAAREMSIPDGSTVAQRRPRGAVTAVAPEDLFLQRVYRWERERGDEQHRAALHQGEQRQKRGRARLDDGAAQRRLPSLHRQVEQGGNGRQEERAVGERVDPACKGHHRAAFRSVPALRANSMDFAASAAPAVISTQAATMRTLGSAMPAAISTSVERSGAA